MKKYILILTGIVLLSLCSYAQENRLVRQRELTDSLNVIRTSTDSLFVKTSHIVKVEEYIGALDTSLGWSLVIQAAVDANLGTGNSLLFNNDKVYEIQSQGVDPYQGTYNHCIDLKTGGVSLIIPSSTTLKLKNNQETSAGINIIVFRNASNIYIGGGGTAFDLFGSKYGVLSHFICDRWDYGGVDVNRGNGLTPADDIIVSDGLIKNTGGSAIMVRTNGGTAVFSNIYVDSCNIGFQIYDTLNTVAHLNNIITTNLTSIAVYIRGNSKVYINGGSFIGGLGGIQIDRTHAGKIPEFHINGSVIANNTYGLDILNTGDANWIPVGSLNSISFYGNTTDMRIEAETKNITVNSLNLPQKTIVSGGGSVFGHNYASVATAWSFHTLGVGYNGQELNILFELGAGNGAIMTDYRKGTGNIALAGANDVRFTDGDMITLRYNADSLRWYQTAVSYNTLYGGNTIIVDGWYYDNVDANLTNESMLRGSGTITVRFYLTRNSYIRKFGIVSNGARTAGTLTAGLWWNASGPNRTVVLDGTNTTINTSSYTRGNTPLPAGTYLEIKITTTADWSPTTADIQAWIELEY